MNIIKKIFNINTFIEKNKKLEQKVLSLKNENKSFKKKIDKSNKAINILKNDNENLENEIKNEKQLTDFHYEKSQEFQKELNTIIKKVIPELINEKLTINNSKSVYEILEPLDKEGWVLYRTAKKMSKIEVSKEFYAEAATGFFDVVNGYEHLKYIEIAKFGNPKYSFQGTYEILSSYNIDYNSEEYINFKEELYYLSVINILELINDPNKSFTSTYPGEKFKLSISNIISKLILL